MFSESHANKIETAIAKDEAASLPLVASWQRSKLLHELSPDTRRAPERLNQAELDRAREELGSLLKDSEASLDLLYSAIGNVGCNVILANRDGIALARRGSPADDDSFNEWGLWTGAIWSESSEGTNGVGTSIVEERPLTIHKEQHFHSKNIGLSCTAAPVFDHEGKLAAVVDVSSCRADLTESFSNLISVAVIDTARKIETDNFSNHFSDARIMLAKTNEPSRNPANLWRSAALIAVDRDDLVVGATRAARNMYRLSDDDLAKPLPLDSLYGHEPNQAHEYAMAENRIIQQSLAKTGGNVSAAAKLMGISRATLHRKIKKFQTAN